MLTETRLTEVYAQVKLLLKPDNPVFVTPNLSSSCLCVAGGRLSQKMPSKNVQS
jgi:hypothetical protein